MSMPAGLIWLWAGIVTLLSFTYIAFTITVWECGLEKYWKVMFIALVSALYIFVAVSGILYSSAKYMGGLP